MNRSLTAAVPPANSTSTARPPTRPGLLRVLVVDDSEPTQRGLSDLLRADPDVQVLPPAGDGEEALRLALQHRPDCVLLDLEMPKMDGFTFLRLLMTRQPTPVVVVSASSHKADVFKALEMGALDVITKPDGGDLGELRDELVSKMAMVRALRVESAMEPPPSPAGAPPSPPVATAPPALEAARTPLRRSIGRLSRLVVIGASTGGPGALARVLNAVPNGLPLGYAVAQHMPERFTRAFAERLRRSSGLDVREAEEGDELVDGRVLIAPGGKHLRLVRCVSEALGPVCARLSPGEGADARRYCPSVDVLFESAAEVMGDRVCAVVLTGMGNDGRRGVERVKEAGGIALAESEATAVVYGMPKEAVETGKVDAVLSLEDIVTRLCRFSEAR